MEANKDNNWSIFEKCEKSNKEEIIFDKETLYFLKFKPSDPIYHSYKLVLINQHLTEEVLKIDIKDYDTGEKELSEIEKWKRKVVLNNKFRYNKVLSLKPTVYKSFIHFYFFKV